VTARHPVNGQFIADDTVTASRETGVVRLPGGGAHVDARLRSDYVGPGSPEHQPCQYMDQGSPPDLPQGLNPEDNWTVPT
jgi:hypothetical protein